MLDYLDDLLSAERVEDVWKLHVERMAGFGVDRLLYGCTRCLTADSFGSASDLHILTNHHPEYLDEFLGKDLYLDGPMVKWAASNEGACSWSWIGAQERAGLLSDAELRVVALNRRHQVTAGYTIGFRDASARAKGGIGLCAAPGISQHEVDALWKKHGREILVSNVIVHLRISTMPFANSRALLTARQREVLEWVGDGKTAGEIARIMGLTRATVEKHLRLARAALEVETTAQAVLKASLHHQIFISPPGSPAETATIETPAREDRRSRSV